MCGCGHNLALLPVVAKKKNKRRYQHAWGLGRHVQGSQVYDYWFDPWGHIHEHMCDGDQINNTHEHRMWGPGDQTGAGDQWGPTEEESTVFNLFGPDRCEYFPLLPLTHGDIELYTSP